MFLGLGSVPIRYKLLASSMVVLLPISLLIYFYFPKREENIALAAMRIRTANMAELVALGVGRGLVLRDLADVPAAVTWVKKEPSLVYVVVVDDDGEVFASYNPRKIKVIVAQEIATPGIRPENGMLAASVPIMFERKRSGTLLMGVSLEQVREQVAYERWLALWISLGVFLLGAAASRYFASRITRPIVDLRKAADAVAQGDYDVTIPECPNDEVGALAAGFGAMVNNLRDSLARVNQVVGDLAASRDEALALGQAKSNFLAIMSHEIRTPMNGVLGMLHLLMDTGLTSEQRDRAETAQRSAESLLRIINDILDFSKIEAGKLELEAVDFDLRATLDDVAGLLGERASSKGLELAFIIHKRVPKIVCGDSVRLSQVLVNLVGNSIKFTEKGEVILRTRVVEEDAGGLLLRFDVSDSGIGIPEAAQSRLFRAFSQADVSTTRRFGGTGLGLAICSRLATLMGGEIGVRSREGEGSTFWVTARFGSGSAVAAPQGRESLTGLRLLAADDHPATRRVLRQMLTAWQIHNDVVEDVPRALELLRRGAETKRPYDVAILDAQMAGMDGFALGETLRRDPQLASTRLILLAPTGHSRYQQEARAMGFAGCVSKPIRQSSLHDCLATVMAMPGEPCVEFGRTPPLVTSSTATTVPAVRRPRILIAEDNPINQKVALAFLERLGHHPDIVENGLQAVEAVRDRPYNLVLMDCQMPEMDGFGATAEIRRLERGGQRVPIIAMTANAMQGDRERCLAAGMDDYVSKPVNAAKLATVLTRWLNTEPQHQANGRSAAPALPLPMPGGANPTIQEAAPIKLAQLEALVGDSPKVQQRFFELFLATAEQLLPQITAAIVARDGAELRRLGHSLKGGCGMVGAEEMARLSAEMESAAANDDWLRAEALRGPLEESRARASAFIRSREPPLPVPLP